MASRRIEIQFLGKDVSVGKAADKVEGRMGKLQGRLSRVGNAAGKVLAGGLLAGGAAAVRAGQAAAQDEAAQAKLAQTLRTAAGASDGQVASTESWITAQGKALGVADDDLRPALGRLAVATKDVGEAQKLGSLAMDISAGSGKSLEAVSTALAKAQGGNVGALGRLGIATKDAQGKTKSLDQITQELAKTYDGAASRATETTAGKQRKLQVQFGELQEEIGAKLLPVFAKLAEWGLKTIEWMGKHQTLVAVLGGTIGGLVTTLYLVSKAMAAVNLVMAMNPIGLVVVAIAGLVAGLVIAYKKSETFRRIVNAAFGGVLNAARAVWNWLKNNWRTLLAVLTGPIGLAVRVISRNWTSIKNGAAGAKNWVVARFNDLVGFVRGLPGRISKATSGMWNGIGRGFRGVINYIIGKWNGLSFTLPGISLPGLGKIGGFTLSTPNIPYLAKGGIVKARPGGTLAMIGEAGQDEAVVPLPKRGGAASLGAPEFIHVELDLKLDGRTIQTKLLKLKRQNGGVSLGIA